MRIGVLALLALVPAMEAAALRGVEAGASCEDVERIELALGSKRHPATTSRESSHAFFVGTHLGHDALVVYSCKNGIAASQTIALKFTERNEARLSFEEIQRSLTDGLGTPPNDADENAVAEMQRDPHFSSGLPVHRFAMWIVGNGTVAVALSGRDEEWELVVHGF